MTLQARQENESENSENARNFPMKSIADQEQAVKPCGDVSHLGNSFKVDLDNRQ